MGLSIEDPTTGQGVGVNYDGFMKVAAVQSTVEHHVNHHHGSAYTYSFAIAAANAPSCILYIKNGSDTDMVVEGFYLAVSGATNIYAEINNTVTDITAGTGYAAFTPTNVNAGSGLTAEGTFAKGTDLATGTSLSAGGEVGRGVFLAATGTTWYNFNQDLIVPKNKVLTLWSSAAVTVTGMVEFNYHKNELG